MNAKDKQFIKEVISSDLRSISNPDFNLETINRIKSLQSKNSLKTKTLADFYLLIPLFIFSALLILQSIIKVISLWIDLNGFIKADSMEIVTGLLLHPVSISLVTSFLLLYYFDSYLMKHGTKFVKPNRVENIL